MGELTHEDMRRGLDRISDHIGEWQGVPVPLGPDHPVILHDRHPLRDLYRSFAELEVEVLVGGPPDDADPTDVDAGLARAVERSFEEERIVNRWFSWKLNVEVVVFQRPDGRAFAVKVPRAPDGSMDRMNFWLTTLGASDAWDEAAEHRAREKLRGLLTERQWRHYDLTGCFLETSERSKLTYLFRRLRPTIVLTPRGRRRHDVPDEHMRCLAVLCMHPIGYYGRSWGGCLVPSDDVIAHLIYMRSDEAGFWRVANQHEARSPEAGL